MEDFFQLIPLTRSRSSGNEFGLASKEKAEVFLPVELQAHLKRLWEGSSNFSLESPTDAKLNTFLNYLKGKRVGAIVRKIQEYDKLASFIKFLIQVSALIMFIRRHKALNSTLRSSDLRELSLQILNLINALRKRNIHMIPFYIIPILTIMRKFGKKTIGELVKDAGDEAKTKIYQKEKELFPIIMQSILKSLLYTSNL